MSFDYEFFRHLLGQVAAGCVIVAVAQAIFFDSAGLSAVLLGGAGLMVGLGVSFKPNR